MIAFFIYATAIEFWERPNFWIADGQHEKVLIFLAIWVISCLAIYFAAFSPYNTLRLFWGIGLTVPAGFGLARELLQRDQRVVVNGRTQQSVDDAVDPAELFDPYFERP